MPYKISTLIFIFTTMSFVAYADIHNEPIPIQFRLDAVGYWLGKYETCKQGEMVSTSILMQQGKTFILMWEKVPLDNLTKELDGDYILEKIIITGQKQLPEGLAPERDKLLSFGRYKIKEGSKYASIWIAEFEIHDETPTAGSGYPQTLFIPMGAQGQSILKVEQPSNSREVNPSNATKAEPKVAYADIRNEPIPIQFRLDRIGYWLGKYETCKQGEMVSTSILMQQGKRFILMWEKVPLDNLTKELDSDSILEKIVVTGQKQLPEGLAPERDKLLSFGRYKIKEGSKYASIWIAEFEIHDETPMAGYGYPQTLFIPMGAQGQSILKGTLKN